MAYHAIAPTQVARIEQGQGLGTKLLVDALERIGEAADRGEAGSPSSTPSMTPRTLLLRTAG